MEVHIYVHSNTVFNGEKFHMQHEKQYRMQGEVPALYVYTMTHDYSCFLFAVFIICK